MKHLLSLTFAFLLSFGAFSQGGKIDKAYEAWDQLLQAYVTPGGHVNYKGFKADKNFDKALSLFAAKLPADSWTKEQEMAYWINVYNAYTVKLIVDNYPLKSINDIKDPWDQRFIVLEGKEFSLNQIEHEILRPKFKDPRVHFAINCASFSCPVLHNRAILPAELDATLVRLTKDFLNDLHRNRIYTKKAEVSQIFEWFASDFEAEGGVRAFIEKYRGKLNADIKLSYLPYDWSLNELPEE